MATLTREAILGAPLAREVLDVPEWGGQVIVQELSGVGRDRLERERGVWATRAGVAAASVIDEEGNLLFGPDDIEELAARSGNALQRILDAANRLSSVRPEAVAKAKSDLKATRSGSSGSS